MIWAVLLPKCYQICTKILARSKLNVPQLAGVRARPARPASFLFFLLRAGPQGQLAVHRVGHELDVEPLSIGVCPRAADPGPDRLLPIAVLHMVGNMRRGLRRGRGFGLRVGLHRQSPSRKVKRETGRVKHTSIRDRLGQRFVNHLAAIEEKRLVALRAAAHIAGFRQHVPTHCRSWSRWPSSVLFVFIFALLKKSDGGRASVIPEIRKGSLPFTLLFCKNNSGFAVENSLIARLVAVPLMRYQPSSAIRSGNEYLWAGGSCNFW